MTARGWKDSVRPQAQEQLLEILCWVFGADKTATDFTKVPVGAKVFENIELAYYDEVGKTLQDFFKETSKLVSKAGVNVKGAVKESFEKHRETILPILTNFNTVVLNAAVETAKRKSYELMEEPKLMRKQALAETEKTIKTLLEPLQQLGTGTNIQALSQQILAEEKGKKASSVT